jgi:nitrite reductase (cytochrome c-552)
MKKGLCFVILMLTGFFMVSYSDQITAQPQPLGETGQTQTQAGEQRCFGCHLQIGDLHRGSPHNGLGCGTCHAAMNEHLQDPRQRPRTDLQPDTCGNCHPDQYESFNRVNWEAPARLEKGLPQGRSPAQEKLLAPHGFTIEHNEPRAHPFMLIDQIVVDRFAAGRYQFKDRWQIARPGGLWDRIEDTGRTFPWMRAAGNPTCLQCKTSDLILKWKYMGDPDPQAQWDRTSDIHKVLRDVQNPMGCIHCHDPHGTQPRIVRDALIEAVQRDGATPYEDPPGRDAITVIDFRDFRKIGLVKQPGSNLLCGQCHVEYNCNPGIPPEGEGAVGFEDRRTNYFPMRNVLDVLDKYDEIGFRDFRHAVTGARLVKLQHPEMETFWGSPHERAGVRCVDCHMLKKRNAAGEVFTSHQMVRPMHHVEQACLRCHPDSSAEESRYIIEATQNYTIGKIRKAEYHLELLIDTYALAARSGVSEEVLAQARREHEIAHVLWEWWTAENSDGWHNPVLARDSLSASEVASKRGIEILERAMRPETDAPIIR